MIRAVIVFALIIFSGIRPDTGSGAPEELPPCEADGNDTPAAAMEMENSAFIVDVVCPADTTDFYYFHVPAGADVEGDIMVLSPTPGTVFRLTRNDAILFQHTSTEDTNRITVPVSLTDSEEATFYMRITYSENETEHYYAIMLRLELTGCFEEGNADKDSAERIFFGDTVRSTLCENDMVDWHWFHINEIVEDEEGWLWIDPGPWPARVEIYDAHDRLVADRTMESADEEFRFSDLSGIHRFYSYYIKMEILDPPPDELFSYTLRLGVGPGIGEFTLPLLREMVAIRFPLWPSPDHDKYRTSRTHLDGPFSPEEITSCHIGAFPSVYMPQHPAIGPSGNIYFINHPDTICCADTTGNKVWQRALQYELDGPFLDTEGLWTANDDYIYHYSFAGEQLALIGLPSGMTGRIELLGVYDDRLYFIGGQLGFQLWCLRKDGSIIYTGDAMGYIFNIAVDRDNNVYASSRYNLTKFDSAGNVRWRRWVQNPHRMGDPVLDRPTATDQAPHVGNDSRIFLPVHEKGGHYRIYLFGGDASETCHDIVEWDNMPAHVAIDTEGSYCFTDRENHVWKYDRDLNFVWMQDIAGPANDMLVDRSGRIYIAYHVGAGINIFVVRAMNPDGRLLWQETLEGITAVGQRAYLAIDNENRLMFITSTGDVFTFKGGGIEAPVAQPGYMQPAGTGTGSKHVKDIRPRIPGIGD